MPCLTRVSFFLCSFVPGHGRERAGPSCCCCSPALHFHPFPSFSLKSLAAAKPTPAVSLSRSPRASKSTLSALCSLTICGLIVLYFGWLGSLCVHPAHSILATYLPSFPTLTMGFAWAFWASCVITYIQDRRREVDQDRRACAFVFKIYAQCRPITTAAVAGWSMHKNEEKRQDRK